MQNTRSGFQNSGEYISAGLPWVTSSLAPSSTAIRIDFFKVTRGFTVRNLGPATHLHVGFTQNGVQGGNRYTIPSGSSERFETRAKELWLLGSTGGAQFCVSAELTLIDASMMPTLTGSAQVDANGGSAWQGVGAPVDERLF